VTISRDEFEHLLHRVEALENAEARTSPRMLAVVPDGFERIEQHLDRHDEQFEQIQRRLDRAGEGS
jgi:hypothetical protein